MRQFLLLLLRRLVKKQNKEEKSWETFLSFFFTTFRLPKTVPIDSSAFGMAVQCRCPFILRQPNDLDAAAREVVQTLSLYSLEQLYTSVTLTVSC